MVLLRLISERPRRIFATPAYQMKLALEIYAAEATEQRKDLIE